MPRILQYFFNKSFPKKKSSVFISILQDFLFKCLQVEGLNLHKLYSQFFSVFSRGIPRKFSEWPRMDVFSQVTVFFFSCSYSSWEFCKHSLWFPSRTRSQAGNCHPRGPTEHQALDSNFGGESSVRAPLALRCTIEQRLAIHTPF